jgi:hypothetical protein
VVENKSKNTYTTYIYYPTDSLTGAKPRSSVGEKGKVGERVMDEGWLLVVYDGDFREKGERNFFHFIY